MSKLKTTIHESRTDTKSIGFSNGGFIELEIGGASGGYLKLHVAKNERSYPDPMGAWRWIQHATDDKNVELLKEIRDGADTILKSVEEAYGR